MKSRFRYTTYDIKQIIPATGWKCFVAYANGRKTTFVEYPVVAWALAYSRTQVFEPDNETDTPDVDDVSESATMVPLVFNNEVVLPMYETSAAGDDGVLDIFPPGSSLDQVKVRRQLRKTLSLEMKYRAKDRGMSVAAYRNIFADKKVVEETTRPEQRAA